MIVASLKLDDVHLYLSLALTFGIVHDTKYVEIFKFCLIVTDFLDSYKTACRPCRLTSHDNCNCLRIFFKAISYE